MADLTIVAADVQQGTSNVRKKEYVAGETITQGMPCRVDATSGKAMKAEAGDTAAKAVVAGISINSALLDQPVDLHTSGDLDVGAALTVGTVYVLSATAGKIAPITDLVSTDYVSLLGVATAAGNLKVVLNNSGVQKA